MRRAISRATLAVLAAVPLLPAQARWLPHVGIAHPPARTGHRLVWCDSRSEMLLVQGWLAGPLLDLWTWRAGRWQLASAGLPIPPRHGYGACYHRALQRLLLFGGQAASGAPLNDLWSFDGTTWQAHTLPLPPAARFGGGMTYIDDPVAPRAVVFGGTNGLTAFNDTYHLDMTAWTPLGSPTRPPARSEHAQVWDPVRREVVVFGGLDGNNLPLGDTWTLNAGVWSQRTTPTAPSPRAYSGLAFDRDWGRAVLHGGTDLGLVNNFADTWHWNGNVWSQAVVAGVPGARDSHAMEYDPIRRTVVTYGGLDGNLLPRNDTWELAGSLLQPFGTGCTGSVGVPVLAAAGGSTPRLGTTFQVDVMNLVPPGAAFVCTGLSSEHWGTSPLPLPLAFYGMPGCSLFVSVDSIVVVLGQNGTVSHTVAIPSLPNLLGMLFFMQAFAVDGAANAAGLVPSNAARGLLW